MKQAIGFTPAAIKDRMERNTFQKNTQERIHHEKADAIRAATRARMADDPAAEERASEKVETYNERFPEERIKPKSIKSAIKRLRSRSDRMEFGVDLDDKLEERIKDQTAPSIYSRE